MIGKSMALLFLSLLVFGTSSQAVLMGYESFNYPEGSLNGQNDPNDGFRFAWYTSTYSVDTNGLSMPNYPLTPVGGAMSGSGGAARTLSFEGLGLDAGELIDFSQEQTRYLSVMMKRTPATWIEMRLQNADNDDVVKFGLSSIDQFALRMAGANAYGGDCSSSNTYFMVLKIVAHASADDEIFLQGYSSSAAVGLEPTSWTVTNSTNLNDVLTRMDFTGKAGFVSMVDEIVIGTSWEDVASGTASEDIIMGYESFNYPEGSLNGQNDPADGFKFAWYTSTYSVDTNGLSMPNYPLTPVGGAMSGSGGAARTLSFEGLGLDAGELIDFSQEQTRYLSVMMKRTPATWIEMKLQNAAHSDVVKFGLASNDKFVARMAGQSVFGGDCSTSNTYFIVLKLVAHASADDEVFLKGYSDADPVGSEPTSWTASLSTNLNDVLTVMDFTGKSGFVSMVDEIVIGTSWDVVAPPSTTPAVPSIVSLQPFAGNVMEMVVNTLTPWLAQSYYPSGTDNLAIGNWTNVAHSIDGNVPFIVTNLSYSTVSGSNNVIYVEAAEAAKFFKIDAVGE